MEYERYTNYEEQIQIQVVEEDGKFRGRVKFKDGSVMQSKWLFSRQEEALEDVMKTLKWAADRMTETLTK